MTTTHEKIGVLLINTGSPASPNPNDIKPYLLEFLSDRNLIKVPRVIWMPILKGIICRTRPQKTAPRYAHIWTPEGAPLLVHSYAQRDALNQRFAEDDLPFVAEVGMRYGSPSIDEAMTALEAHGCHQIIALPLFPQPTFSTVKTCKEKVLEVAHCHPNLTVDVIEGYAANPWYLDALAASIKEAWSHQPSSKLLLVFHSIPLSDIKAGDTYLEQIKQSVAGIVERLSIPNKDWAVAYHSRFEDSRAWVTPHPKTILAQWANEHVGRVAVITPGFASDCLESLYDVDVAEREYFTQLCQEQGKKADFTYIPALNSRPDHIEALYQVIMQHLSGS